MSTRGDRIYDGFTIQANVVASVYQSYPENYGKSGVLFASQDDYNGWYNGMWMINQQRYISPQSCSSFWGFEPLTYSDPSYTYEAVGGVANAAIGYPASDVVSTVQYWIDSYGNQVNYDTGDGPYEMTVHSEPPTSIDFSGSSGNSLAFSPIGHYAYHYATDSIRYVQTFYQIGDTPPAGSGSIHLSFTGVDSGGNPLSWNYTSTFSVPSTVFNPDTAALREQYTAYTQIVGDWTDRYGTRPNPTPTRVKQFSGSFTYEPAYYFNHA